jgi:hypothetical protein
MANKKVLASDANGNEIKKNRTEKVSGLTSVRMEEELSEKMSGLSELIIVVHFVNFHLQVRSLFCLWMDMAIGQVLAGSQTCLKWASWIRHFEPGSICHIEPG